MSSPHVGGVTDFSTHPGFAKVFSDRLTLGVFFPIEAYTGDVPRMEDQEDLAEAVEALGFDALWFRDVPLRDPTFGDVGQIYDPWVYLAHIAAHTRAIALVTGAIVLPLRHPLHVAKAAASVDRLSGGRLVLGVATGDRLGELVAFGIDPDRRGELFESHLRAIRDAWREALALDVLPKPPLGDIPVMITGRVRHHLDWIAAHADAWATYPRPLAAQAALVAEWQRASAGKPFAQSLYIDLDRSPSAPPRQIHLGWSLGRDALVQLLVELRRAGVGHIALNLKYGRRAAADVVDELGNEVLPRVRSVDAVSHTPAP
ncbi:MAG: TIGR03571 family LLM class oxidoreductase [Deltaproteobacteria bacterium]|nr:TIGR03571 family LLM class oxidoreductase [Kofleriaceae bacterium]